MATPLDSIADWPVSAASAAVVGATGVLAEYGDVTHQFRLASVTKLLAARAAQVAIEEGVVELDTPAGPPGSTVRHLLSHASGLAMHSAEVMAEPGKRRVYSNYGFQVLAETIERNSEIEFGRYLAEAVFEPLGMAGSRLEGGAEAAGYGGVSTVADLEAFAADLLAPKTVSAQLHEQAISVQFPGLTGVLPGFGVQRPNDWGLGFEIRDDKSPHWTGFANSPRTFGHFGQTGTFIWVEPELALSLVVLTDRDFDEWAKPVWRAISDEVLRVYGAH
ncbi:beta-lactamase [Mycolicibacterium aromaticivorans JS19b1 = JCM 16368]|uniref:Beta-lactamase n=1 Tax=Mycolicibacterium aromaticivorans JS19b1 = JCM 16368 TaxID=1440774 RepID=A0A064CPS6_9MYCO|nr:serine hydrolase domain-containing protein [Mycolicibacterium aromaticivorans]KDF01687.1 beta-lactamase [Mycolicibacterium aromaticivorans JS19b1 = JCM 16368]